MTKTSAFAAVVVFAAGMACCPSAFAVNQQIFGGGVDYANSRAAAGSRTDCEYSKRTADAALRGVAPNVRWISNQYMQCGLH